MWFDHAVFFMINHLTIFFQDDLFPTLPSKFAAFLVWMTEAARIAVRHQVIFAHTRDLLCEAAVEFAADPEAQLLAKYPEGQGIRNVIRLIKPAGYSVANPSTPGSQGSSGKRTHRINCNVEPDPMQEHAASGRRSSPSGTRGGRGNYNKRYRTTRPTTANANDTAFVFYGNNGKRSPATPRNESITLQSPSPGYNRAMTASLSPSQAIVPRGSPSASSRQQHSATRGAPRFARASLRGRALDWDSVKF